MIKKIILIGGGGHCKTVIDSIITSKEYEIVGIVDIFENIGKKICSIPIIGTDQDLYDIFNSGIKNAFITVGSVGNMDLFKKLYIKAMDIGFIIPKIIDKTAILGMDIEIGYGCYIGKNVVINSNANIGEMSIINTGSIIEHDCEVGNFVHIAPGSILSGGVKIGEYTHIGVGTTIIQGVKIGSYTFIGAGSVVVSNIQSKVKAFGVPCKEVGKWETISLL